MNIDQNIIKLIVEIVLCVITAVIGRFVIPYVITNVDAKKLEVIKKWALIFVNGAENVILGDKKGEERCQYVTGLISDKAKEIGINMSSDDIRAILEDAYNIMCREMKNNV